MLFLNGTVTKGRKRGGREAISNDGRKSFLIAYKTSLTASVPQNDVSLCLGDSFSVIVGDDNIGLKK